MSNPRQFPRLDDLAFRALLRNSVHGITPNSQLEYDVLFHYKMKAEVPLFLQAIADGDQHSAMVLLEDNPLLALMARSTVTTYSGYTIKDVTAIQLAYVLEDNEMLEIMLPHLNKLDNGVEKASRQINQKIIEVKKQKNEFSHYNYTNLINAVSADLQLRSRGIARAETEKALADFKAYFKPVIVNNGQPFNMNHLIKTYQIYHDSWTLWAGGQLLWFIHNVIGYLHCLVPASYFQAFSQGLPSLSDQAEPFNRHFKLLDSIMKNEVSDSPINTDLKQYLYQIFPVEMNHDNTPIALLEGQQAICLKNYVDKRHQALNRLCDENFSLPSPGITLK